MAIHLTPTELAREAGMERREVIEKCMEMGVPIFQGRIDKTLFIANLSEQGIVVSSSRTQVAPACAARRRAAASHKSFPRAARAAPHKRCCAAQAAPLLRLRSIRSPEE